MGMRGGTMYTEIIAALFGINTEPPTYPPFRGSAEPWDESKTKRKKDLCLSADTFRPPLLLDTPPDKITKGKHIGSGVYGPDWCKLAYVNRTLKAYQPLQLSSGSRYVGQVRFDGEVVIPTIQEYTYQWEVVMSYTPNEVFTMRSGVSRATGGVVIGGLGLGTLLRMVHAKPSVTSVVVVELQPQVVEWHGGEAALMEKYPKLDAVVCDDVYRYMEGHAPDNDTRYLLDIWNTIDGAAWDRRADTAIKAGYKVWCWGSRSRGQPWKSRGVSSTKRWCVE